MKISLSIVGKKFPKLTPKKFPKSTITASVDSAKLAKLLIGFLPKGALTEDKLDSWTDKIGDFMEPVADYLGSNSPWLESHTKAVAAFDLIHKCSNIKLGGPIYRGVALKKSPKSGTQKFTKITSWSTSYRTALGFSEQFDAELKPFVLVLNPNNKDIVFSDIVINALKKESKAVREILKIELIKRGLTNKSAANIAIDVFEDNFLAVFGNTEDEVTLRPGSYDVKVDEI